MARMYPNQLDPATASQAEHKLYRAFEAGLDSQYIVFHSVAWQSLDSSGRPRDGEADFVIAHPQRGILVVEAKGGGVRFDPRAGEWYSLDRASRANAIKDPFDQAKDSKYVLLDLIKQWPKLSQSRINIGHAVAFPDVLVETPWLGPDRPRQIILDANGMTDVSGWVGRALAYWRGGESQRNTAPGEAAIQALMEMLGKSWELRPVLWGEFVQEKQQLVRLTEQQYMILDILSRQRRAAICGCAGSGKTMLAAEKATRLARQGFRVLLTCFNKNLATDLGKRLERFSNLDVARFHSLCIDLARQANVLPAHEEDKEFYEQLLPQALWDAADKVDLRYDAIVVDEGQDFLDNWWLPLQSLLRDPDGGILYIFFDDNQRIYVQDSAFPISQPPYALTVNCRNTQSIHTLVTKFYTGDSKPTSLGPAGRPVEVVKMESADQLHKTLSGVLERLTRTERIPTDEIVVLTTRTQAKSLLWARPLPGNIHLTDAWPPEPNQVFCASIHAFKGLESAVVILCELERYPTQWGDLDQALYVACSRACHHLVVLLPADTPREISRCF